METPLADGHAAVYFCLCGIRLVKVSAYMDGALKELATIIKSIEADFIPVTRKRKQKY